MFIRIIYTRPAVRHADVVDHAYGPLRTLNVFGQREVGIRVRTGSSEATVDVDLANLQFTHLMYQSKIIAVKQ